MLIRNRIVCGTIDSHLTERFLREKTDNLTLTRVTPEMATASEISKEQLKVLRSESSNNTVSLHVGELKTNPARKPDKRKTFNCGSGTVHAYRQYPAFGSRCRNCAGYNHYEKTVPIIRDNRSLHMFQI